VDEISKIQAVKTKSMEVGAQSSRSSQDSVPRVGSPALKSRTPSVARIEAPNGQPPGAMDYVYLKNVLLQFLEQKDKKHQMQLVPVLGMLLHFDRSVTAAIVSIWMRPNRVAERMSRNGCPPSPRNHNMKRGIARTETQMIRLQLDWMLLLYRVRLPHIDTGRGPIGAYGNRYIFDRYEDRCAQFRYRRKPVFGDYEVCETVLNRFYAPYAPCFR